MLTSTSIGQIQLICCFSEFLQDVSQRVKTQEALKIYTYKASKNKSLVSQQKQKSKREREEVRTDTRSCIQ